jgi:hypothetical protein
VTISTPPPPDRTTGLLYGRRVGRMGCGGCHGTRGLSGLQGTVCSASLGSDLARWRLDSVPEYGGWHMGWHSSGKLGSPTATDARLSSWDSAVFMECSAPWEARGRLHSRPWLFLPLVAEFLVTTMSLFQ